MVSVAKATRGGGVSREEVLAGSARLADPKFEGLIDRYLGPDATILKAGDGDLSTVGLPDEYYSKCAFVLTPTKLWAFRGRGLLGPKKPVAALLNEIEKVTITRLSAIGREDQVGIVFKLGATTLKGGPEKFTGSQVARWQLKTFDYSWTTAIGEACGLQPTT